MAQLAHVYRTFWVLFLLQFPKIKYQAVMQQTKWGKKINKQLSFQESQDKEAVNKSHSRHILDQYWYIYTAPLCFLLVKLKGVALT